MISDPGKTTQLLEGVVRLTAQADILALCGMLYRAVQQSCPDISMRIYERAGVGEEFRVAGFGPWGAQLAVRPDRGQYLRDLERILRLLPQLDPQQLVFQAEPDEPGSSVLAAVRQGTELLAVIVLQGKDAEVQEAVQNIQPLLEGFANLYRNLHRASHDKLTGLLNRQTFDDRMAQLVDQVVQEQDTVQTQGRGTFYVIADIDHFKQVNDRFGHLMGDEVLLRFARVMVRCFRSEDLLFRFGGEEFVVLLNNVTIEQCAVVLNRFRAQVAATDFPQVRHVSCSIGFARLDLNQSLEIISERADKALYYAKEHGRNQVQGFEHLQAQGALEDDTHQSEDVDLF